MPRYFIIPVLLLALVSASALTADKSSGIGAVVHGGGLTCFTVEPTEPYDRNKPVTCNSFCESKGTICTGVTSSMNPPQTCEVRLRHG